MPRKEFEMLFTLEAQLNSGFSGTIGKAQQQFLSFQKEFEALQKIQRDVSAYQKQQQAVESSRKKLEVLQQQYDNIQKEIQETGTFSSDLENKLLSKQQQIDRTSASLGAQTERLNALGASLREAGVDTSALTKESERLSAEMAEKKEQYAEAAKGAQDFGASSVSAFEAAANALAAAGLVAGLKKIYAAYQECIGIAGDFEASMSSVAALSGASAEELEQLAALAKELGATTKFTAKESADAMGYMAMAGWDAEQMLSGMPGVLNLAAASGEDLASVSDIVTDSLTAFGLKAEDTARFADVLAATAANANTNVSMMGETFKTAAPLAGALGYSVEDVATAVGLMANAGIKGSVAGTSLKNIFNGLLDTMTLTGEAFGEINYSAINADGTMKSFGETLEDLRYYFGQMTGAERLQNAEALVGQRAMSGFINLMTTADLDLQSLTESINNSTGAAQRMADIRMDNMTGQLTLLNSAWEAVQTTVGEQFTPVLQELYGVGAEVLGEINTFLQEHPQLIKAATVLAGGLGAVTTAIVGISAAAKVLKALNIGSMLVGAAGLTPLGWVAIAATGVTALTAAIVALKSEQSEEEREIAALTATSREQYYQLQELREEYDAVCAAQGEYSADAQLLKRRLDEETAAFEEAKLTAEDAAKAHRELMDAHAEMMASYADQTTEIDKNAESNLNLMNRLFDLVNAEEQTAAQKQQILTLVDMLNESLPELALAYDENANALNLTADAVEAIIRAEVERERNAAKRDALKQALEEENTLLQHQQDAIIELNAREAEYGRTVAAVEAKKAELDALYPDGTNERRRAAALNEYYIALQNAKIAMDEASVKADEATTAFNSNQEAIRDLTQGLATYSEEQLQISMGSREVAEIISRETERIQALTEEYNAAYAAAKSSVEGQYQLWDTADQVIAKSADSINSALGTQLSYWQDYNANLAALGDRTDDIAGLREMLASFADGSKDSVAAVAGMVSASDADLQKMVGQWQELQQAQKETEDAIAELKTNYSERMQELTEEMAAQIQALDLSDDAAKSGRATIQGFIDAAADEHSRVVSAYKALGLAAAMALAGNYGFIPNKPGTVPGGMDAYATGTDYARSGFALVGEYGPELMLMHGGEQIIPADETRALLKIASAQSGGMQIATIMPETVGAMMASRGGSEYQITTPITVNIEGNATPETIDRLQDALSEFQEEFAERVLGVIEEAETARAGRAYK